MSERSAQGLVTCAVAVDGQLLILTPHLRSPTERALGMQHVVWIGGHFSDWSCREFILLSILPTLAAGAAA